MSTAAAVSRSVRTAVTAPSGQPVAIRGRSGSGKTTLIRAVMRTERVEPEWTPARDVVDRLVAAIRSETFEAYSETFVGDPRPLVLEHLEDLRGKPQTREMLKRLVVARAAKRWPVVLTLSAPADEREVGDWLATFADVLSLD